MTHTGTENDVTSLCGASLEPNLTGKQKPLTRLGLAWCFSCHRCSPAFLLDNLSTWQFLKDMLSLLIITVYMCARCMYKSVVVHVPQHICGDQGTQSQSWFCPFTMGSWNRTHNQGHRACTYNHRAQLQNFKTSCKCNTMFLIHSFVFHQLYSSSDALLGTKVAQFLPSGKTESL